MKSRWIVGLVKRDRRALVVYGPNYFPHKFRYKAEAVALVKNLKSFDPPIECTLHSEEM